jgi:NDP-sugar pyrophosphorylase family protein
MILAAGTGTRLRPMTDFKPKALVEINGIALLEVVITKLISQGILSFTINVHHFADQIIEYLDFKRNFGVSISISDETGELLDSGGGIYKASSLFPKGEEVLIHNVDVISNLDVQKLSQYHQANNALASLAVRHRATQRYCLFDKQYHLVGWMNSNTGEKRCSAPGNTDFLPLAFSGISVLSAEFINNISHQGRFSIWEEMLKQSGTLRIMGYLHNEDYWIDVGREDQLKEAEKMMKNLTPGG